MNLNDEAYGRRHDRTKTDTSDTLHKIISDQSPCQQKDIIDAFERRIREECCISKWGAIFRLINNPTSTDFIIFPIRWSGRDVELYKETSSFIPVSLEEIPESEIGFLITVAVLDQTLDGASPTHQASDTLNTILEPFRPANSSIYVLTPKLHDRDIIPPETDTNNDTDDYCYVIPPGQILKLKLPLEHVERPNTTTATTNTTTGSQVHAQEPEPGPESQSTPSPALPANKTTRYNDDDSSQASDALQIKNTNRFKVKDMIPLLLKLLHEGEARIHLEREETSIRWHEVCVTKSQVL